jgi:hypothetical protein
MGFSFSNLLKSKKETVSSKSVPKIELDGATKYAENDTCNVYLDFEELGGFPYIKTILISDFSVKIKRDGCTLTFYFSDNSLTIHSDNTDIASNPIKNTPFHLSEIDFEINEQEAAKIKNEKVMRIEYQFKNNLFSFKTV